MLPSLTWSIDFGNILAILTMVSTVIYMHSKQDAKLQILTHDMVGLKEKQEALSEAFVQIGRILTQVAVQDNRMNMLEKQVDDLRHGHGFVDYQKGAERAKNALRR